MKEKNYDKNKIVFDDKVVDELTAESVEISEQFEKKMS